MNRKPIHQILCAAALLALVQPAFAAAPAEAPYGRASFHTYKDINQIKTLKTVWDFNFQNPAMVGVVFNNLAAFIKAVDTYGPHSFKPWKIVVVSHGPEVVVWDRRNYQKFKAIVDRAHSFAQEGVRFEICRNDAAALGLKPRNLYGFLKVIPAGPYALAYWQNKGYAAMEFGATVPTKAVTPYNKNDLRKH